jgi:hypothetical protein
MSVCSDNTKTERLHVPQTKYFLVTRYQRFKHRVALAGWRDSRLLVTE